jgi:hypothetical protein
MEPLAVVHFLVAVAVVQVLLLQEVMLLLLQVVVLEQELLMVEVTAALVFLVVQMETAVRLLAVEGVELLQIVVQTELVDLAPTAKSGYPILLFLASHSLQMSRMELGLPIQLPEMDRQPAH